MPQGRPRTIDSVRRRKTFVRLVLTGATFEQAATEARVQPLRALRILDELEQARLIDVTGRSEAA